jgi:hypothetical protein
LQPNNGRQQDIHFARFNFLDRPGVQRHHFGKPFLGDSLKHSFPADIVAERFEMRCLDPFQWHALLRRFWATLHTAQWGVKKHPLKSFLPKIYFPKINLTRKLLPLF